MKYLRGESPTYAQTIISKKEVQKDLYKSRQHSLPLEVRLVVSTVALSAVLQPGEGEPGPEEYLYNYVIIKIISAFTFLEHMVTQAPGLFSAHPVLTKPPSSRERGRSS